MTFGMRLPSTKRLSDVPKSAVSSSKTTFTTFWAGVSESRTSASKQRCFVREMKPFTTLKLTSASRRAMRISRMASLISSSVRRPLPLRRPNTPWSLSESDSSMLVFSLPVVYLVSFPCIAPAPHIGRAGAQRASHARIAQELTYLPRCQFRFQTTQ